MTQEAGCGCVAVPSAPVRRGLLVSLRVSLRVSLLVRVPLAAAALVGAAVQAQPAGEAVRVVDDRGRSVMLPAPPARIVSLLPSLTETVCALGACARLVGVDRHSSWPAAVAALPRLGGLEDTQVERLVALRPADGDEGRDRGLLFAQLECPRAAAEDFLAYLSMHPAPPDARQIRERLDQMQRAARRLN